jgi:sugar phosphate isomerase/epimerase
MEHEETKSRARVPLGRSFGIMQGRLSRQSPRGYQTFPAYTWIEEFRLAKSYGFEHIEWVIESFDIEDNPLLAQPDQVRTIADEHQIDVVSVCADFLLESPLHPQNSSSWNHFERMMSNSGELEIEVVVIPCVDSNSLLRSENLNNLETSLPRMVSVAENCGVLLALETDLAPRDFKNLLEKYEVPQVSVNYDSGNSASLGYDFAEEMEAYGDRITDFHLKDRMAGGPSVELGSGSTNLNEVLRYLSPESFNGIVTMQAMRDSEGPPSVRNQLAWINAQLNPQDER